MILSCNSCEKKFVVPDQAISIAGRTVQCGSCGNKWKQFPLKDEIYKFTSSKKINTKKRNHYYFKNNNLKINLRKLQLLREKA